MARTSAFDRLVRALKLARSFEADGLTTRDGLQRAAFARERQRAAQAHPTRRDALKGIGAAAIATVGTPLLATAAPKVDGSVGIVGAGLAGLAAADRLAAAGLAATVYEARDRMGGRQWSMGASFAGPVTFPGQVVERGGELIDTTHTTMKNYARQLGLQLEDVTKEWLPGEVSYFFEGTHVTEEEIVDEFRALARALRPTLASLSNYIAFDAYTPFDAQVDRTSLRQLLEQHGAGRLLTKVIDTVYTIEYGREIDRQSSLALLFFMHIDHRSRFQPFGVFSDERYHVVGGNEQIARGLAARLPGPIRLGMFLEDARKLADGRIELTFTRAGRRVIAVHDAVILTLPFSILRSVNLDGSLEIPAWQRDLIERFDYGQNTKLNVGFVERVWGQYGSEGASYSDLPDHQTTWEANPSKATPGNAVLLDYSGGRRAERLNPSRTSGEAERWLTALENIWPGASNAAKRTPDGQILAHMQHWPSDPLSRGSYTSNPPGYFTQWEGRVGSSVGNLFFAGEHTDPFYEWQGFMEGACNSGIRAADLLLDVVTRRP